MKTTSSPELKGASMPPKSSQSVSFTNTKIPGRLNEIIAELMVSSKVSLKGKKLKNVENACHVHCAVLAEQFGSFCDVCGSN